MNKKKMRKPSNRRRASFVTAPFPGRLKRRPAVTTYNPVGTSSDPTKIIVSPRGKVQPATENERAVPGRKTRQARQHQDVIDETENISPRPKGGRVGGKPPRNSTTPTVTPLTPGGHAERPADDVSYHYWPTRGVHEDATGAEVMRLAPFIVRKHGREARFKELKKMNPLTNFLLSTPSLEVGGTVEGQQGQKFPLTSACGIGRTGIAYPFGWHDVIAQTSPASYSYYRKQKTWQLAHGTSHDYQEIVQQLLNKTGMSVANPAGPGVTNPQQLANLLVEASNGTTQFKIPITGMETEYEIFNKSSFKCTHMMIYLVTPKKVLDRGNDPLMNFFRPFDKKINNTSTTAEKQKAARFLPDKMIYKPCVQANPGVIAHYNTTTSAWESKLTTNSPYISTLSTEIVPEASLKDSRLFRENWKEIHAYKVCLQPQQAVKFSVKTEFHSQSDLLDVIGYDPENKEPSFTVDQSPDPTNLGGRPFKFESTSNVSLNNNMFPGETIFPIIRFWGDEVTGTSIGLRREPRPSATNTTDMEAYMKKRNIVMDQTCSETNACLINMTVRKKAYGHFHNLPVSDTIGKIMTGANTSSTTNSPLPYAFMDCVMQRNKNFRSYDDKERGQSCTYFRVNENILSFSNEHPIYSGFDVDTVAELDTTQQGPGVPTNWPMSAVVLGSTNDANNIEVEVVTNQQVEQTQSTV